MVRRNRLIAQLEATRDHRVVVVAAPAGYGKTTLLAQWAAGDPRQVVWLTVHAYDHPSELAARLVAALGAPTVSQPPLLPVNEGDATWYALVLPTVGRIVAEIRQPVLIVVDDAGQLEGTAAEALVGAVIEHLPAGSQLVLATRREAPRALRRLRPAGDVLEIGPDLLAMDPREAETLLAGLDVELDHDAFDALLRRTEGWPVGLYLLALALLPGSGRTRRGEVPALAPGWVTRYIRDELFDALDPTTAEFLLTVSVLDELTGPACDAVAGTTGSLGRLRSLAEGNSLVVALDAAGERFRLHHLYADFLRDELLARSADDFRGAQAAASLWCEGQGLDDAAVAHARLAGDDSRLGQLVWSLAPHLLATGRWAVLRQWLADLDERRITGSCALSLTAAYVASHRGDMPAMSRFLLAAEARCSADTHAERLGPSALDVGLIKAIEALGGIPQMVELSSAAVEGMAPDDPWLTLAHYLRGIALLLLGRRSESIDSVQTGLRLATAHGLPVMQAHALAALAVQALVDDDLRAASTYVSEARALVVRHGIEHISTAAPIFSTSAQVYVAEGRLVEAEAEAVRALRLTLAINPVASWHGVLGRLQLAETYARLGDRERARMLLDEARERYVDDLRSPVLDALVSSAEALLPAARPGPAGAAILTTAELRVLQYLPSHLSFPEIGQELFLSRHTVKSQAMSTYRKLDVRSRSEAVAKARAMGLLPTP